MRRSFSVAEDGTFAYTHTGPHHPADVAIGSPGQQPARRVTRLNDDLLSHRALGKVESFWCESGHDARGFVVYLYTSVKQQLERTQSGRERPLLGNDNKEKVLQDLMDERDQLYREISDLIVETDGRRVQTVAREIQEAL